MFFFSSGKAILFSVLDVFSFCRNHFFFYIPGVLVFLFFFFYLLYILLSIATVFFLLLGLLMSLSVYACIFFPLLFPYITCGCDGSVTSLYLLHERNKMGIAGGGVLAGNLRE